MDFGLDMKWLKFHMSACYKWCGVKLFELACWLEGGHGN